MNIGALGASETGDTVDVLVVEDNLDFADNLGEILAAEGARLRISHTVADAERVLDHFRPDIAFVDLRLPDGSGDAVVASLSRRTPQTLVIVLTGNASLQSAIATVDAGAFAYLLKDMPVEAVLAAFRKARERLALERHNRRLEARLRHQEQLAVIGQMAAMLAHEIKNPLTGVRHALEVILDATGEPPGMAGIRETILSRFRRLNELVEDLLKFSKPIVIERASTDVALLVEAIVDELRSTGQLEGVEVRVSIGEDAAHARIDGDHLGHVLRNLVHNAAIAMARSAVKIIEISVRRANGRVLFEVADTGTGIALEHLSEVFKPFFTTRTRGTGLGLAIASRIVEEHGGTIAVRNRPAGGACFTAAIPG